MSTTSIDPLQLKSFSAADVRELYLEYCRVGKILSADEDVHCARLAEALRQLLRTRAGSLLEKARVCAVLYSYSCDATSYLCQVVKTAPLGTQGGVLRRGRVLHEFLMQRGHLFCKLPDGRELMALLFKAPVPLSFGEENR